MQNTIYIQKTTFYQQYSWRELFEKVSLLPPAPPPLSKTFNKGDLLSLCPVCGDEKSGRSEQSKVFPWGSFFLYYSDLIQRTITRFCVSEIVYPPHFSYCFGYLNIIYDGGLVKYFCSDTV